MISGRDIVFISSIEWDFLWQVHQEIAFQFAAAGNRVIYIENTGVRGPALRDADRVAKRLTRWFTALSVRGARQVQPNIFVVSPLVMPPFGSQLARFLNRRLFLPLIKGTLGRMNVRDPLLWTYLPTDTAAELIRLLATPASVVAYYCGADFSQLAADAEGLRRAEDDLIRSADLVFATCAQLFARCIRLSPRVQRIPAVVNLDRFQLSEIKAAGENKSREADSWRRPVVGYVGGLHRWVDYPLLKSLAQNRPDWSWVFVGARTADVDSLDSLPNVHFVGPRPHSELAGYIRSFDVCLVPYLNCEMTATVVPLKINEYLAMGKPVVSTDLPTIVDFNQRHEVLRVAPNDSARFLAAIEEALSLPADDATRQHRRDVASLGGSQLVVTKIAALMEARMQEKRSAPAVSYDYGAYSLAGEPVTSE